MFWTIVFAIVVGFFAYFWVLPVVVNILTQKWFWTLVLWVIGIVLFITFIIIIGMAEESFESLLPSFDATILIIPAVIFGLYMFAKLPSKQPNVVPQNSRSRRGRKERKANKALV